MLFTAPIRGDKRIENPRHEVTTGINRLHEIRSRLSATTHVDFSSRIQTVDEERHPDLHRVLTAFHKITSLPALVNTSFNVRGEPIVNSAEDAFHCFMSTDIDVLVIDGIYMRKEDQNRHAGCG